MTKLENGITSRFEKLDLEELRFLIHMMRGRNFWEFKNGRHIHGVLSIEIEDMIKRVET